jgi:cell division protease FtsH
VKDLFSKVWFWAVLGAVLVGGVALWAFSGDDREEIRLDEFLTHLVDGQIETAAIESRTGQVTGDLTTGSEYVASYPPEYADELTEQLLEAGVEVDPENSDGNSLAAWLFELLPVVLVVGVFIWFFTQMAGGGRAGKFGRSGARERAKDDSDASFADVAGVEEAVEELEEIKDFLSDPERFHRLGARIPKGVLLYGPPGTGKTLLAKAVAGEAGVPFFTISGSDFVEMFVGIGAARVRDLFKQAKESAPAIIFVDEIDAVGRHRGGGVGGGHDEREQTLNQMLVEMDGFDSHTDVILVAATNRLDILDPALLRPGRFDRHIAVDAPDRAGRQAILEVHSQGKPFADDVSLAVVARRTPGFTGADLANIVNEAALLAGRRHAEIITMEEMSEAIERVMAGPERRSVVMGEKEKAMTAYHEAGHALVGHVLPDGDPVHKVSIVARGQALGWTLSLPTEDRYTHTRPELAGRLALFMGGLSAEELVFHDRTTGAADDIKRATELARAMVTEMGMSPAVGPQRVRADDGVRPGSLDPVSAYSEELLAKVDAEVETLLDNAHATAREILERHRDTLDVLAARLIEQETIDEEELNEIFATTAS